jgi:hypothetical protein
VVEVIMAPEPLVFGHGTGKDNYPRKFRVPLTFAPQSDGKITRGRRQRPAGIDFGAAQLGYQTPDKKPRSGLNDSEWRRTHYAPRTSGVTAR